MKLKDYPMLETSLIKHYDHSNLYAPSEIPEEWMELEIVYKYVDNRINKRVLVIL